MKALYKLLNWYTQRFAFPTKGWKYVQPLLQRLRLSDKVYKKKLFNDLFMYVNAKDHIQQTIFWYGHYEKEVSKVWQSLIDTESIVVDIGANIGYFTVLAAAKATKGKIYCFEPVSVFRKKLFENTMLNGFQNVMMLPFGVSNKNALIDIFLADENNIGMTSLVPPQNFSGKKEAIETVALDDWSQNNLQKLTL